jgi:SWI/SNF-related matrix-associated actin-dependent regulator of chromatin subfamily A-like protein 1
MTTKLYPYQKEGIALIEKFDGRVLLADEQGLGKTVQALEYLRRHPKIRPAVIVCPASVKYVWEDQAKQHCGLRVSVCQGQKPPKKGLLRDAKIFVINYDILLYWANYLRDLHPQIVICDEIHLIKSRGIGRTRAVRKLCSPIRRVPIANLKMDEVLRWHVREDDYVCFEDKDGQEVFGYISSINDDGFVTVKTQIPHLMGLSGTPLTNRPEELWTSLNLIWPQFFPAFTPYAWEFCEPEMTPYGWKYHGAANLDVLHKRLKRIGMIRRLKRDVLKDLPSKRRVVVPLDIDNRKDYDKALNDFINWLTAQDAAKAKRAKHAEKLVQMAYLRRLAAEGKIRNVCDWIDSFLEEADDKLVVGCLHHSVINKLHEQYRKISVTFTGKTSAKGRRAAIIEFRKDPRKRIIFGQIKAIGTGVDGLQDTASTSTVIEFPWDPGTVSQFDDRIHRIGQKRNVTIYYLVARDTLEEKLCRIIQNKQDVLTRTLDGEKDLKRMRIDIWDQLEKSLLEGAKGKK